MNLRYPIAALFLFLLSGLPGAPAHAATCSASPINNGTITLGNMSFQPGSPRPIGGQLGATWQYQTGGDQYVTCWGGGATIKLVLVSDAGLVPGNGPGRYQTGIPGTEMEIGFGYHNDDVIDMHAGWETVVNGARVQIPRKILVRMVRTESHIARTGSMPAIRFTAKLMNDSQVITTFNVNGTLSFAQDVMLMSCTANQKNTDVPMGVAAVSAVSTDAAPVRSYAMDVKCEGNPPGSPAPVKVYFVGDTTPDGMLRLSDLPDAATGVGISVFAPDGTKLPFSDRSKALDMTWIENLNGVDRYRFEGRAKYMAIPGAGEPRAGRADAVMSYVLDYN